MSHLLTCRSVACFRSAWAGFSVEFRQDRIPHHIESLFYLLFICTAMFGFEVVPGNFFNLDVKSQRGNFQRREAQLSKAFSSLNKSRIMSSHIIRTKFFIQTSSIYVTMYSENQIPRGGPMIARNIVMVSASVQYAVPPIAQKGIVGVEGCRPRMIAYTNAEWVSSLNQNKTNPKYNYDVEG